MGRTVSSNGRDFFSVIVSSAQRIWRQEAQCAILDLSMALAIEQ
jgi:hypothetical protein